MNRFLATTLSALLACAATAAAQNPESIVTTVGKTFATGDGSKRHNYILWQPGDLASTYDKRFAVYAKEGGIESANPYQRLGIQVVQSSPSAVHALLCLGATFDADAGQLPPRLATLYHGSKSNPEGIPDPLPAAIDLPLAAQLAELIAAAKSDPRLLERLMMLGRAHPGVLMAMGHGFAIEVPPASLRTYEVREIDALDNDLRVIGRVSLDAANPQALAAPGRPHAVPHDFDPSLQWVASNKDHLNARLRWATPDDLRDLLPHSSGFNLYRVAEAVAELKGWNTTPPTPADLLDELAAAAALEDPPIARVNMLPVFSVTPLSEAEASDPADRDTVFFADDKNPPDDVFTDGEAFYYFVAARDIAGHIGPVSPGTRVVMCHRVPPDAPDIEEIINTFRAPDDAETIALGRGLQHLTLRIRQLPDGEAGRYFIYRWNAPAQWMRDGGDPMQNLVAAIDHVPGQEIIDFHDAAHDWETLDLDSLDPASLDPTIPMAIDNSHPLMGKTLWYTVRAEDLTACAPKNLSGHSNAEFGVLRDRTAPDAPGGAVTRCLNAPECSYQGASSPAKVAENLEPDFTGLLLRFERLHRWIQSVEVELIEPDPNGDIVLFAGTRVFRKPGPMLEFPIPARPGSGLLRVRCFSTAGVASNWATTDVTILDADAAAVLRTLFAGSLVCTPELIPPSTPETPTHDVIDPDGGITPLPGVLTLQPGDRQWRVYRRIDNDSDLELIASGAGEGGQADWSDDAPPTLTGTIVCYYGQVLDEHGNASPMARIQCVRIRGVVLPTPLLSEATALPAVNDEPGTQLRWFCDPAGVDRFEIWIAFAGGEPTFPPYGGDLSPPISGISPVQLDLPDGGVATFHPYQSPGVGTPFGEAMPQFAASFRIPSDSRAYFAVRAVGAGDPAGPPESRRTSGPFSNVVALEWAEPPPLPPQDLIPWPARPLASVQSIRRDVAACAAGEGPLYAAPAKHTHKASALILVGAFPSPDEAISIHEGIFPAGSNPRDFLFKVRPDGGATPNATAERLFPFAVYRYQVGGYEASGGAEPNLVQVTPLIDQISHHQPAPASLVTARDPFFVFLPHIHLADDGHPNWLPLPLDGEFNQFYGVWNAGTLPAEPAQRPRYLLGSDATIWVRDPLPAVAGASYQYLIVRFTERGEIDRVIPTNLVQHEQ